jgi:prolyl-tRNA synthetase
VKLSGVKLIADHAVMAMTDAVTGANQAEAHLTHVLPGRDFAPAQVADLRFVAEQDRCPKCQRPLSFVEAIEVGHVFKLGTKYTQALGAAVQHPSGETAPMIMGCYGIGVNRIAATAVEQRHDANGIIWPVALAPFQVVVSVMEWENPELRQAGEAAYDALTGAGFEVLLDDREQSPGSKFKDADLIGIPVQVVVGKTWKAEKKYELSLRATKEKSTAGDGELVEAARKHLDKASSL